MAFQFVYSPEREAPLCRQHRSTAPRAHNTGALRFFIHGVQSRFPDIFHARPPETHSEEVQRVTARLTENKIKEKKKKGEKTLVSHAGARQHAAVAETQARRGGALGCSLSSHSSRHK